MFFRREKDKEQSYSQYRVLDYILDCRLEEKAREKLEKIRITKDLEYKDLEYLKQEAKKYLKVFKNHPYIFNLGHGVLPETNPNMVEYLIKFIKDN